MPYLDRVTIGEPLVRGDYRIEPITTGAAVARGDFVKFSSGTAVQALTKSGTASTVVTSTGAGVVCIGVCLHDAASGETVQVAIADDQSEFFGRILHGTGSSAEQADVTLGNSYNLGIYTIGTSGPGVYGVSTVSSTPDVIITEKSPESASGDDFGFVWFKFKNAFRAYSN